MEFKKGDKLICKKSLVEFDLIKDKAYYIIGILNDNIYYFSSELSVAYMTNEAIPLGIPSEQIYLYFYSEKELRKEKIKKLRK